MIDILVSMWTTSIAASDIKGSWDEYVDFTIFLKNQIGTMGQVWILSK